MENTSDAMNPHHLTYQQELYYGEMTHPNMTHRPHFLEYVAIDLPIIILCMIGWLMVACLGEKTSPWTVAILAFFTLYLFLHCQYITSMKYHIGLELLMYSRGLFSVKRDYIEMYRIVDYEESRSFLQMLFGLKTVTIHACDRTTPNLKIIGIPKNLDVIPTIRERCEYCKKKRGVYEIANR